MMKTNWKSFLCGIICTILIFGLVSTAAATIGQKTVELNYNNIQVTLDGEPVKLVNAGGETVEPFTIKGTTYLPVRAVVTALGLDVDWDAATKTVILSTPQTGRPIYITRTGIKYHYDNTCNGGIYWEVPYSTAIGMGLTPCDKCVHD